MLLVACLCSMMALLSCIGSADDDELAPPSADTAADTTAVTIDSAFMATAAFVAGEWMAQYTGYDPRQSEANGKDVESAIRRLVFFSPDGFYDSHVQGIVDMADSTITQYKEFEHEHGTYAFDEQRQMMTYSVEYDSLLDFAADRLVFHAGKMLGQRELPQYGERLFFSLEKDGRRDWVRADDNLMRTDDHTATLTYIMKNRQ